MVHKPTIGLEYEFLRGLAGEFQQLRGNNRLQCVNIVVELARFQPLHWFKIGDEYVFLDETLTDGGWPELREVEICAKVDFSLDPWTEHRLLVERIQMKSELEDVHFYRLEKSDQVMFKYLIS